MAWRVVERRMAGRRRSLTNRTAKGMGREKRRRGVGDRLPHRRRIRPAGTGTGVHLLQELRAALRFPPR